MQYDIENVHHKKREKMEAGNGTLRALAVDWTQSFLFFSKIGIPERFTQALNLMIMGFQFSSLRLNNCESLIFKNR